MHFCATITLAYIAFTPEGFAMPALTGIVDLALRARIP